LCAWATCNLWDYCEILWKCKVTGPLSVCGMNQYNCFVSSLSMSLFMFDFEPPHLTLFQTLNKTLFCFKLQIILQTLKKFLNKPTQFTLFFSPSRWSCYHFVLHLCVNFLYTILIYKIWLKKHYSFVSLCKFILKRKTKNLIQSPKKTLIHMFFFQIRNCSIVLACSLFLFISEK